MSTYSYPSRNSASFSNVSKNSAVYKYISRAGCNLTWENADMAWEDQDRTWDELGPTTWINTNKN